MRPSRHPPRAAQFLIDRLGQLDQQRVLGGVEPAQDGQQVVGGHCGAAGGAVVGVLPAVEEDAGAAAGQGFWLFGANLLVSRL